MSFLQSLISSSKVPSPSKSILQLSGFVEFESIFQVKCTATGASPQPASATSKDVMASTGVSGLGVGPDESSDEHARNIVTTAANPTNADDLLTVPSGDRSTSQTPTWRWSE